MFRRAAGIGWLLLAAAVVGGNVFGETNQPKVQLRFVQVSDTHWGARDGLTSTRRIVEAINALPMRIEFVAHTGDIMADNIARKETVDKGLAIMAGLWR